jgi:hypothetical protein
MLSTHPIADATLTIRDDENQFVEVPIRDADPDVIRIAHPYRTFRWYRGQRHYSGSYWSSTESAHVIYESRLELARLLMADFDTSVTKIIAQPFLLRAIIGGKVRRHIPDYWLLTRDAPIVVDVKPAKRMSNPIVQATFAWTRELMESIGWRFEVANEPPESLLENVRFLSGYRRAESISAPCLAALRALNVDGMEFRDVKRLVPHPEPLVRAAILHMLWTQEFTAGLSDVLDSRTVLRRGGER